MSINSTLHMCFVIVCAERFTHVSAFMEISYSYQADNQCSVTVIGIAMISQVR